MPKLTLDTVKLYYGSAQSSTCALSDVSLEVAAGESVALIGPSGCGKSSILRLACGLIAPSSGCVFVDGQKLTAPREKTALILQDFGLLDWKTVGANAALGLKVRHIPKAERKMRVDAALAAVGLTDMAQRFPSQLSGGMKQRVALARALALDVDLLLLDEPTSALDAYLRERMQDMLCDLQKQEGYAQVLVTHSIEEAVFLGSRIFVMGSHPGHIVEAVANPEAGSARYRATAQFYERCEHIRALLDIQSSAALQGGSMDASMGLSGGLNVSASSSPDSSLSASACLAVGDKGGVHA